MTRPLPIRLFELLFLLSIALSVVQTALVWPVLMQQATAQTAAAHVSHGAVVGIAAGSTAVVILITLLLWWFVARQGSVVAKWLTLLVVAYGAYALLASVRRGALPADAATALSFAGLALQVLAVAMLFSPGARPWFARSSAEALA